LNFMWKFFEKFSNLIEEATKTSFDGESIFLNFTPRALQVCALAKKEADRFSQKIVGTEHLLLGLLKLGQGVAVNVLRKIGVDLATVRLAAEKEAALLPKEDEIDNVPYTLAVKKVLNSAQQEAKALRHTYVGTEHILLGLLREGNNASVCILKKLGVNIEQTRQEILAELNPNFAAPSIDPFKP
jgi:ATP-dependent Clp protease ATP-binding subunit ClpC